MDQQYIDLFFDTGELRLSSFHHFHKYNHDERGDSGEGRNIILAKGGELGVLVFAEHGPDALVMSTSLLESEDLKSDFGVDSYFRIDNPTGFAHAIAASLDDCWRGMEGYCLYREHREIVRDVEPFRLDDLRPEGDSKNLSLDKVLAKAMEAAGTDVYFVKTRKYARQQEYRFVWRLNRRVEGYVTVTCPEAVKHCTKRT